MDNIVLRIISVILCLTVHEFGHAYVAYLLGDKTAKHHGRLTLNPISHIDPIGLLSMIFFSFGWAKPVPIRPRNFKNYLRDTALVALAGPLANILCSLILFVIIIIITPIGSIVTITISSFLATIAYMGVGLAVFNLLPIPPLDGSRIFMPLFPQKLRFYMVKYQQFIQFGLLVGLFTGILTPILAFLQIYAINAIIWVAEKITFFV